MKKIISVFIILITLSHYAQQCKKKRVYGEDIVYDQYGNKIRRPYYQDVCACFDKETQENEVVDVYYQPPENQVRNMVNLDLRRRSRFRDYSNPINASFAFGGGAPRGLQYLYGLPPKRVLITLGIGEIIRRW